jgi:hypothetical protein
VKNTRISTHLQTRQELLQIRNGRQKRGLSAFTDQTEVQIGLAELPRKILQAFAPTLVEVYIPIVVLLMLLLVVHAHDPFDEPVCSGTKDGHGNRHAILKDAVVAAAATARRG